MVLSMTGFATKNFMLPLDEHSKVNIVISLKSLNSRFFETTFKLPHTLSNLETDLIKVLKKKLVRGHMYLTIYMSNQAVLKGNVEPSTKTIEGYLKAVQQIKKDFSSIEGNLSLDTLLTLPNVFMMEEKEIDPATIQLINDAVNTLVDDVIATKKEEGTTLQKDILQRIAIMTQEITAIDSAAQVLMHAQKEKVNQAIQELDADETKLAEVRKSALFMILDKIDIHEELVRFKSHLANITQQLESADIEKGKRLDFTLQELGREINTIAAKCSDANIGARAINIKVELEKAREQTQNIV